LEPLQLKLEAIYRRETMLTKSKHRPLIIDYRPLFLPFYFLLLTLATAFAANAQSSTATLSGTVTDENDAVVVGATVKISNTATGFQRTFTTDENGSFTFPLLPPSSYVVTIEHTGFALFEARDVVLNVNDQRSLRVKIKVGQIGVGVVVTPEAPLISDSPAVSSVVNRQ